MPQMSWFYISWIVVCLVGIQTIATLGVVWMNHLDHQIPNDPKRLGEWLARNRHH